jgi:aminoglycoside phosphotransferase (APT) family kinase protein
MNEQATMGNANATSTIELDERELARTLTELLSKALSRPVRVDELKREPSSFATLFPAEVLSVSLVGEPSVRVFLKHLGSEQSEHPDKQRRDREIRVYEQLLRGGADLPVPRYYGSRWNGATQRYELYLEYIDDWNLKYHELKYWFAAARRLADLHAHFARRHDELSACDFLLRLDGNYFRAWGQRAVATMAQISPQLYQRITRLLDSYDSAITLLGAQPTTLVHNDLSAKNVIANCNHQSTYFIDWEMGGVGCALLDLAHLKYGLDVNDDRRMIDAYREQLARARLLPSDEHEFGRLLAACELQKTLYRLAHSATWRLPLERVTQWVGEAEAFLRQVRDGS